MPKKYKSLRILRVKWTRSELGDQNSAPGKAPKGGERRICWHGAHSNDAGAAPGGAKVPHADPDPAIDHEMVENIAFGAGGPGQPVAACPSKVETTLDDRRRVTKII